MKISQFPQARASRIIGAVVLVILVGGFWLGGFLVGRRGSRETVQAMPAQVIEVSQDDWTIVLQMLIRAEDNLTKAVRIIDRQQYTLHLLAGGTEGAWGE